MKKIFRMLIFSALALFLTSLWDKGFLIKLDFMVLLKASLLVGAIYYLITPISKIILLPLNILTLGLMSTFVFCFLFYFLPSHFGLVTIKEWTFSGMTLFGFNIGKMFISKTFNVFVSAISVSTIINFFEHII